MEQEKDSIFAALRGPEGEEVVIQAGCVPAGSACMREPSCVSPREDRGRSGAANRVRSAGGPDPAGRYGMITTEDDLKAQVPYSGMRRVILALAALALAAAIAYACIVS